jgi:hypothetical protein
MYHQDEKMYHQDEKMYHQDEKRFQIAPLTIAFTFLKKPIKPKTSTRHQISLYHNMSPTAPYSLFCGGTVSC